MKTRTRRPDLSADLFTPRCADCDRPLVGTPSGFLACPRGHGKLVTVDTAPDPATANLFDQAARRVAGAPADAFRRLAAAERGR